MNQVKRIAKKVVIKSVSKSPKLKRKLNFWRRKRRIKKCKGMMDQLPVEEKTVIFESFMGRGYSCSPKAIYQYMKNSPEFQDYTFIWAFRKLREKQETGDLDPELEGAELVQYRSLNYYKAYARAKYFVTNSRLPEELERREGQVYLQCWHGTPLKRIGHDIKVEGANATKTQDELFEAYDQDARRYSYMVSPSAFCTEKLRSAFALKENNSEDIVLEMGYPRNDFLYNYTEDDVKKIKRQLGIKEDDKRKLLLYAPTWRDNQHEAGLGYTYKLGLDFDKLIKEIGDEYIILFRPHYFVANSFDFAKYAGYVYDVSGVDDINELYVIADMLMTDYSSVFFDYANLKRPILFYMYDLKEYKGLLRDFYIPLSDLPGEIIEEEKDLADAIRRAGTEFVYDDKYKQFNDRFTYLDDGKASERVVKYIVEKERRK